MRLHQLVDVLGLALVKNVTSGGSVEANEGEVTRTDLCFCGRQDDEEEYGIRDGGGGGVIMAFPCTIGAVAVALYLIYNHLLNYTEPVYQRYIVRIIFMVPIGIVEMGFGNGGLPIWILWVHAVMSFLALVLNKSSIYFNSIREVYEAWVIYNFLSLCLAWVGGPGAVVLSLSGRVLNPSVCLMTCCFPPIPLDGRFIRRCKQGALQFVILKPILVVVTFILHAKGKYQDGNFSIRQAYLYITILYTVSYTIALYALALFYVACKDLLRPFNPVPKFLMIKSVVFLTYWQGVLFFLAARSGFMKNAEEAARVQNLIICIEMLIAALGHLYAFPYKEYANANIGALSSLTGRVAHALKFNDFYDDTFHQFAPTYHDYVLYNHTEGDDGEIKYRSRTFVPTGLEMDTLGKKSTPKGRIDDIEQPSHPPGIDTLESADAILVPLIIRQRKLPRKLPRSLICQVPI
ncbi:hypothetical protein Sjap_026482 [Stephania japonica]|uniref:Transmembrane protein 184A n=1 Tax=Stephania japonica TaxID=461633 RepID=A0AAP0HIX9_9MAGN